MTKVFIAILSGLGHEPSNGIIYNLASRLQQIPDIEVRVGSYRDWRTIAREIQALPAGCHVILIGHSLGASILPALARLAFRTIACIYGFDPALNPAANVSEYALTSVPKNVRKAVAFTVEGLGLGGGEYDAEDPRDEAHPDGATVVEKTVVPWTHTSAEESIEDHLRIGALARRMAEAA